jgi:type IV pilus assembly protein PilM
MIRRTYVGLDLGADQLTAVAVQHGRPALRLAGAGRETVAGAVELSSRQPNVTEPQRFVEALRRVLEPIAGNEERIALVLPDRIGRLYLVENEAPFKNRQEGIDILKWRLKASLPASPQQVQLDYQVLERREDGRLRCIAAAVATPILEQFEDLVEAAGRHAVQVEFHSLCLCNYYRPRLDLGTEFLLLSVEQRQLGMMYFAGRILAYQRVREIAPEPEALFRELSRTLVEAAETQPAMQRCPVFAHLDPELSVSLREVLAATLEREVRILDPQLKRFAGATSIGLPAGGAVLAALGAAERLMGLYRG